ncbi:MAG: hypothetical protein HYV07_10090 [Deltaproteobacteria bacterium]|nr:hypothetical protein [Deltaproteobacteria bacterium]
MSRRREVVEALTRLSFVGELLGLPDFPSAAYAAAAWAARSFDGDFDGGFESGELLKALVFRGPPREVVEAVFAGVDVPRLTELEGQVPEGLFEIYELPGLGPKKVRALWRDLQVTTLGELEYAARENRLISLKGFGEKTQAKIIQAIADRRKFAGLFRLDQIIEAFAVLGKHLPGHRIALAGDARRGVAESDRLVAVVEAPEGLAPVQAKLLAAGLPGLLDSSREPNDSGAQDPSSASGPTQLRIAAVPAQLVPTSLEDFGCAAIFATGAPAHVEILVQRAAGLGFALSREGLTRSGTKVECRNESEVYEALGLVESEPERREAAVPLVEKGRPRRRLVSRSDLRGAIHNHTVASDGIGTLEQMRDAAIARGLTYLAITDHSQTAAYAGGLTPEKLLEQRARIDALNSGAKGSSCWLLRGVESDILATGALDYSSTELSGLDVVVASVHDRAAQGREAMTERLVTAASNPFTDVVGHPTGRLLLGARRPADFDLDRFLDSCARNGTAVELNASPQRLDLEADALARAKERGVMVSIGADAHSPEALDHLELGIYVARRAGLSPEDVLNTRSLEALREWLTGRRKRSLDRA